MINLLLALVWVGATGRFTLVSLLVGFILGYFALRLVHPVVVETHYFTAVRRVCLLVVYFVWNLIRSNLRLARDIVTPLRGLTPGIVSVPLDVRGELEITTLAGLITLTPGTLTVDLSRDCSRMYVHSMSAGDADAVRASVKNGIERRLIEVYR